MSRFCPLFELRAVTYHSPHGTILRDLNLAMNDRAITVVMGPAGTGKSVLLRSLCNRESPIKKDGSIFHRGQLIINGTTSDSIIWCPQKKRSARDQIIDGPTLPEALKRWPSATILADEPTVGLGDAEVDALVDALRRHRERAGVVLSTHDLTFTRRVADDVCLLVAGRMEASAPVEKFFDEPPTPLVQRFVEHGNVWTEGPSAPELPTHFHWVIDKRLAGMGKPGLLREEDFDLESIAAAGVTMVISLTEERIPPAKLGSFGIAGHHLPIRDMGAPSIREASRACQVAKRTIENGGSVAFHCHAGLGRTGTMLACTLIWMGDSADDAILKVRSVSKGSIQSDAQMRFIRRFAEDA